MIAVDDRRALSGRGGIVEYASALKGVARDQDRVTFLSDLSTDGGIPATLLAQHLIRSMPSVNALLSFVPALRPLSFPGCHWIVVHDCRHVVEPAAFSRLSRSYRNVVLAAADVRGSHVITISEATKALLATHWPRLADRAETVPSGVAIDGDSGLARSLQDRSMPVIGLAFGHLPNKRPETAARSWLDARAHTHRLGVLYIVGVHRKQDRARLQQLDPSRRALDVLPFLPTAELADVRAKAGIVLLPSSHEGFGLPVLEAMVRHQVPVISGDAALVEVARGRAIVADALSHIAFATGILEAVRRIDTERHLIVAAAASAGEQTWLRTWQQMSRLVGGAGRWRCHHCEGISTVSRPNES